MDCSPPDSSVHEILQVRVLEWVAMLSSQGSDQPTDWTQVSCIAGRLFTAESPGKSQCWHVVGARHMWAVVIIIFSCCWSLSPAPSPSILPPPPPPSPLLPPSPAIPPLSPPTSPLCHRHHHLLGATITSICISASIIIIMIATISLTCKTQPRGWLKGGVLADVGLSGDKTKVPLVLNEILQPALKIHSHRLRCPLSLTQGIRRPLMLSLPCLGDIFSPYSMNGGGGSNRLRKADILLCG